MYSLVSEKTAGQKIKEVFLSGLPAINIMKKNENLSLLEESKEHENI